VRTLDVSGQGINQNEISGLSFDATGKLWVASTQGEIYKISLT
jgi:ligand-binding sensor domain-containing protein